MQIVGTITTNKDFEILWLYVAKLLKKKKKLPMLEAKNTEEMWGWDLNVWSENGASLDPNHSGRVRVVTSGPGQVKLDLECWCPTHGVTTE